MSISTVRTFLEKPGCAIGCAGVMTVAVAIGLFNAQCGDPRMRDNVERVPIATIGEYTVTPESVERIYTAQAAQYPQMESMGPALEANLLGDALHSLVDSGILLQLAKSKGVAATPNTAPAAIDSLWQQQLGSIRETLTIQGRLKPGATPKEVDDAFKQVYGRSLEEQKAELQEGMTKALDDPLRREEVLAQLSIPALLESTRAALRITDEELKTIDDSWRFKRIIVRGQDEAAMSQARKALDEIRGGLAYEAAMEKYSSEPALPNKKVSDNDHTLSKRLIYTTPDYGPLLRLQPGQVSEPIVLPEGTVIFKLIEVKPNPPANFEQNKSETRSTFERSVAQARLQEELEQARKQAKIEWQSPGYEALYRYTVFTREPVSLSLEARQAKLLEIEQAAAKAMESGDALGQRAAALTRYMAMTSSMTGAEPTPEQLERRIAAVQGVLIQTHSVELILELFDAYVEQKDGEKAAEQLLSAARSNHSISPIGQQYHQEINERLELLTNEKMIQPEMAKEIQNELQRWRTEKLEQERALKEQERLDAEAQKRLEEEAKKAAEAAKKSETSQPSPGAQPKTTAGG